MIDVSSKAKTLRYARAQGKLFVNSKTLKLIKDNKVPKGDVLQVSRAAGIMAAKKTPEWIVFCHSIPIDWVEIRHEFEDDGLLIKCEVRSVWRTGVEMEAMAGVMSSLLNAYDMLKPIDKEMSIGEISVVEKKGGKNAFLDKFDTPLKAAVIVLSDSTYEGTRKDKSGKLIVDYLSNLPVDVKFYEILPDKPEMITARLIELADNEKLDLVITTGGTGLGPKDFTPEATAKVIEKEATGIAEAIRKHGLERTPRAMLSRELVGTRGNTLIINMPGSSNGARESMDAIMPGVLHAFSMIWGGGH